MIPSCLFPIQTCCPRLYLEQEGEKGTLRKERRSSWAIRWDSARVAGQTEFGPDAEERLRTSCNADTGCSVQYPHSIPAVRLVSHVERHKSMEFLLASTKVFFILPFNALLFWGKFFIIFSLA